MAVSCSVLDKLCGDTKSKNLFTTYLELNKYLENIIGAVIEKAGNHCPSIKYISADKGGYLVLCFSKEHHNNIKEDIERLDCILSSHINENSLWLRAVIV